MNGISYLYYDAVNQKSSLFRPIVYGLLVLSQRSVSINRFKVRICLASSHCCTNLYPLCIHVSLQSYHGILVGCLEILVQILEVGKLETLRHHHIFFSVSDFVLKGGGV
jgi:hypothetical protein